MFFWGLAAGLVSGPILVYLFKLGFKKLKEKLGPAE